MIDDAQPLKRPVSVGAVMPVSTGLYMNPPIHGIPSGSDTSDPCLPTRAKDRRGSTALSNRVPEPTHVAPPPPPTAIPLIPIMAAPVQMVVAQQFHEQEEFPPFNFSEEFLGVMQEMIRKEVRSYMAGLEQQNGMCFQAADDGFSRINS
ncbi:hypothetical protein SESBI_49431 [Sesbania bispinosa]|nr:hypothetical protein SESBI_49431 [Sesbania bispinosa]